MRTHEEAPMPETAERRARILERLKEDVGRLYGLHTGDIADDVSFLALGADSLLLLQASQAIEERFGVRVPFRLLMDEVDTFGSLATHLDRELPAASDPVGAAAPDPPPAPEPALRRSPPAQAAPTPAGTGPASIPSTPLPSGDQGSSVERLVSLQIEVMARQLELMRGHGNGSAPVAPPGVTAPAPTPRPPRAPAAPAIRASRPRAAAGTPSSLQLDDRQRRHLEALVERVAARTAGSKRLAQAHRHPLADSRSPARFRREWKEICYQITAEWGEGGRIGDVDGNEYVDITMGFGSLLLGHSPPAVLEAVREQASRGMLVGPLTDLPGEVAESIRRMTGVERVTFCNSGTEAVMTALRVARTVSGRDRVALFEGSYHGSYDGVMARMPAFTDGAPGALPAVPGVPAGAMSDVIVLEYGATRSLEVLESQADELGVVLIEPKQSRRPDLELGDFLRELADFTRRADVPLIFDEVVTGFRTHPGGIQALFEVEADLVTYGKAVANGMPIGVVGGSARYMDAIDGGSWSFGDESAPTAEMTAVRGTFFKHPLVMAAAREVTRLLEAESPELQERLDRETERLAERLNAIFRRESVPVQVARFSSLFVFAFDPRLMAVDWDLFFYHLLEKGVYVWEQRVCYLSTAHTEEDVDRVVRAVEETVAEMKAGGFLALEGTS